MVENLLYTVNVVVPIFLFILIGFFCKRLGWTTKAFEESLSKLIFNLLLTANLIRNLIVSDLREVFNFSVILYSMIATAVFAFILSLYAKKLFVDRKEAGGWVQCTFRGNIVLMGLVMATNMCGDKGAAVMTSMIAFLVPYLNIVSTVVLSYFSGSGKFSLKKTLLAIIKNPLVISCVIGVIISYFHIPLPKLVEGVIVDLGKCSTPMAMIMIGSQFDLKSAGAHMKKVLLGCLYKLLIGPAVFTGIAVLLGFRSAELACIYVLFAVPSAASSAIQAKAEGCDGIIAGETLLMTTALSVISLFIGVFTLKTLGVI